MTRPLWQSPVIAILTAAVAFGAAAYAQTTDKKPAKPAPKHTTRHTDKRSSKKPAPKHEAKAAAKPAPTAQAVLLGQFGDWGAYQASQDGKKICFALSKPTSAVTDPPGRNRDPSYFFVSTRPAEKVHNEVSVIVGYPQKAGVDATATIGSASYVMYTENDGAWIKNAAEEAQMVETMRKGDDLVIKSESTHGTKTTDTYSLKGIGDALDKVEQECK
jgi:Invasion associated locus B (IalB) protein